MHLFPVSIDNLSCIERLEGKAPGFAAIGEEEHVVLLLARRQAQFGHAQVIAIERAICGDHSLGWNGVFAGLDDDDGGLAEGG